MNRAHSKAQTAASAGADVKSGNAIKGVKTRFRRRVICATGHHRHGADLSGL
jgi:hypothetical protein